MAEKKSVGIITFHASNNCGSMLQVYALQQTLEHCLNVKAEIIDFSNRNQRHMYALIRKVHSLKDFGLNCVTFLFYRLFSIHYYDYKSFIKRYLSVTPQTYYDDEQLRQADFQYDALISGSDQIWNISCTDADDAYYLNFIDDIKKIAYAPSFGAINPLKRAENPQKYINYLQAYSDISIREENGREWIKRMTGRDVPILLDPTFLLDAQQWNVLIDQEPPKGKYIFYYAFHYSSEVNRAVMDVARRIGLPVYMIDAKSWVKDAGRFGIRITQHSGPVTFLNYIRNAELVFTTSFHGTAFSVIYRKNFWFLNSSTHCDQDDRVFTILSNLALTDRIVDLDDASSIDPRLRPDFVNCYEKLDLLKRKSVQWLKQSIDSGESEK